MTQRRERIKGLLETSLPDISHLLLGRERLVNMVVLVSLLSPVPGDIVRIRDGQ